MGETLDFQSSATARALIAQPICSNTDSRRVTPYRRRTIALVYWPFPASRIIPRGISTEIKEDLVDPDPEPVVGVLVLLNIPMDTGKSGSDDL